MSRRQTRWGVETPDGNRLFSNLRTLNEALEKAAHWSNAFGQPYHVLRNGAYHCTIRISREPRAFIEESSK